MLGLAESKATTCFIEGVQFSKSFSPQQLRPTPISLKSWKMFVPLLLFFSLPVVALASDALDFDNYEVQYQNQVGRCQLASVDEAYKYTILAEDYMIQINLVATVGADDPDAFYEQNVLPRQANNMEVVAPSVGLELTGEDVRQLFVTLSKRRLAYHIWTMPRVCLRPDGRASVYLRETGNVQNGEDGEGGGDVFRVFTSVRLDFNRLGKVRRLVSVRDQTLLGNEVFEGNAPTP